MLFSIVIVGVLLLAPLPDMNVKAADASVYIDGELVDYDVEPRIENNRTLVPLRKTAELLGYKVIWNQKKKTVDLYNGTNHMKLHVNQVNYTLNGNSLQSDVKTKMYNGRTLIPLRMVVDFFDHNIQWDQKTSSVLINTTGQVIYPPELLKVPVLMYHHFDENTQNSVTVSPVNFEKQMIALKEAGYETISTDQIIAFLNGEGVLPNKPILITMDDGYESNYTYAYKTLKELDMKATIFLITSQVVHEDMRHTINGLPKLSWEQVIEMSNSGLIDFQSHTHDAHFKFQNGLKSYAAVTGPIKKADGKLETKKEYEQRIYDDFVQSKNIIEEKLGKIVNVLCYPFGAFNATSEAMAKIAGYKSTISVKEGYVTHSDSPYLLKRINVDGSFTSKDLINKINEELNK